MAETATTLGTELVPGQKDHFEKTISESDVYLYAGITGDMNPAHVNAVYAGQSRFKGRIAHGMLTAGIISAVVGTRLPGPGSIYMGQELRFLAPVMIGDTIRAEVEVLETRPGKRVVTLKTTCTNQDGVTVLDGVATVLSPR
jgi:3-hydroxybutyryl-CoA dehydratase